MDYGVVAAQLREVLEYDARYYGLGEFACKHYTHAEIANQNRARKAELKKYGIVLDEETKGFAVYKNGVKAGKLYGNDEQGSACTIL